MPEFDGATTRGDFEKPERASGAAAFESRTYSAFAPAFRTIPTGASGIAPLTPTIIVNAAPLSDCATSTVRRVGAPACKWSENSLPSIASYARASGGSGALVLPPVGRTLVTVLPDDTEAAEYVGRSALHDDHRRHVIAERRTPRHVVADQQLCVAGTNQTKQSTRARAENALLDVSAVRILRNRRGVRALQGHRDERHRIVRRVREWAGPPRNPSAP